MQQQQQQQQQKIYELSNLPETILADILSCLNLTDRRRAVGTCKSLWNQRTSLEEKMTSLKINNSREIDGALMTKGLTISRPGPVLQNLSNLIHLDLQSYATDTLLYLLPTAPFQGTLKSLCMARSTDVTDVGLMLLSRRQPAITDIHDSASLHTTASYHAARAADVESPPHRASSLIALEYIDITFCRGTSFSGTFWLRDGLPNLKCIRRQPKWMDGHFYTPFGDDEDDVEIHTYWPDGTFQFTRDRQSNGFVADLFAWEDNNDMNGDEMEIEDEDRRSVEDIDFVGDKLQYNNSSMPHPLPTFTQFAYRPGVSLMRLPPEPEKADHGGSITTNHETSTSTTSKKLVQCVLVAQYLDGLKPPSNRRWMEQAKKENIPLGTSKYYFVSNSGERTGELVESVSPEAFALNPQGGRPIVMISKMKLLPFESVNDDGSFNSDNNNNPDYKNPLRPPNELLAACRNTCKGIIEYGSDFLDRLEEELDELLRRPPTPPTGNLD